ncbi:ion transporter [Pannonibacter sp. Q-1]
MITQSRETGTRLRDHMMGKAGPKMEKSENIAAPEIRLRARLARQLDVDLYQGRGLSILNTVVVWVILFSVILVILETESTIISRFSSFFYGFEWVLLVFFSLEYLLRLWCAPENPSYRNRLAYVIRPLAVIDLLVIATMAFTLIGVEGVLLRLLRLFRLLRLAKLGRFSQAFRDISSAVIKRRYELCVSLIIAGVLMLVSASLLYVTEAEGQPEAFGSIPRAMWWSMATLTTVGYGDIVPITPLGRFFATFTAVMGIGLIAMPAGILASAFSEVVQKRDRRAAESGEGDDPNGN